MYELLLIFEKQKNLILYDFIFLVFETAVLNIQMIYFVSF